MGQKEKYIKKNFKHLKGRNHFEDIMHGMKDNIKKNVMLSDGFKKSSMRSSGGLS
jgi:hypothetical protein